MSSKVTRTPANKTTKVTTSASKSAAVVKKQQPAGTTRQTWQPVAGGRHCHCHCAEFGVDGAYAYYDLDAARGHRVHHHYVKQQSQPQQPQQHQQQPPQQQQRHPTANRHRRHEQRAPPQRSPERSPQRGASSTGGGGSGGGGKQAPNLLVKIPSAPVTRPAVRTKSVQARAHAHGDNDDNDSFLVVSSSPGGESSGDFLRGGSHLDRGEAEEEEAEEEYAALDYEEYLESGMAGATGDATATATATSQRSPTRRPVSPTRRSSPSRSHREEKLTGVLYQHKIIEIRKLIRKLRTEHCTCKRKPSVSVLATGAPTPVRFNDSISCVSIKMAHPPPLTTPTPNPVH